MKYLCTFLLATSMLANLCCNNKPKEPLVVTEPILRPALSAEQTRELNEKRNREQIQKRKNAWTELVKATPFYTDAKNVIVFNQGHL